MYPVSYFIGRDTQIHFQDLEEHYVQVWVGESLCLEGHPLEVAEALDTVVKAIRERQASNA